MYYCMVDMLLRCTVYVLCLGVDTCSYFEKNKPDKLPSVTETDH